VDASLIFAIIEVESGFQPDAVSAEGAKGLMQLMPRTARMLGVADPFDPQQNIAGGTLYLAQMSELFGGNLRLTLAAYNAGPGNVQRYGGVPPFPETRQYINAVLDARRRYQSN
jgi:soluble lytic murein transglycosylase-like protein